MNLPVSNSSVAFPNNPVVQAQLYILVSRKTAEAWDTAEHHDPCAEMELEEKLSDALAVHLSKPSWKLLRKLKPSPPASFS